jgi:FixJ family two-component response regulator
VKKEEYIYVVDDDQSARSGIARLLRTAGHAVREFASTSKFLEHLKDEVAGCIVLDIRMPGLSGSELMTELKLRCIDLPIIVITGDDDSETRMKADKMKAIGFFRKPVDGHALLDAIDWALRSSSTSSKHEN